ncbi:hypothetical protein PU02_1306 [Bartonella ancashensis]|uniref:Uncharacterized protein n=1 Tax=Bartonella ancashensis TaxID=1318743 RepID=A0A0M4L7W8_9HYPH|nr:hypothetical protein PU02_1306 [Bartonella ancashensis]
MGMIEHNRFFLRIIWKEVSLWKYVGLYWSPNHRFTLF